ncbi:glycerate kinase type-2 family protein [Phaeovulum sp. W22_SRMD_FR3]|uniref:glycerate kinase type-2 family protein n=1 Tax=Phaeovulum sp. W22_SRMD_FR3 TaxID=3240274 RepID=UPI003F9A6FC3
MGIPACRAAALEAFLAGVAAADPGAAVTRALAAEPMAIGNGRRVILALGKAAPAMALAARLAWPGAEVLVVTHPENRTEVPGARVLYGSHPVPGPEGAAAAEAVLALAVSLTAADQLLVLISGGASALLPAPVEGVTLADKIAVTRALLASGAEINQMNLVRQNLSRLKGGGLARAAAPAQIRALILSDVIGDDLSAIGSGPTVAPLGDAAAARDLLQDLGLWAHLPTSVVKHLERNVTPPPLPPVQNQLIGSNSQSLAAMVEALPPAMAEPLPLVGDVGAAALRLLGDLEAGPVVRAYGGETTVQLQGKGLGGRNQELALRLALLAEAAGVPEGWVFLSAGTDGRDGPTEAAGALVDSGTLARMRAAGVDPVAALAENDSNPALAASGDLIVIGATGTNVADLQILWPG